MRRWGLRRYWVLGFVVGRWGEGKMGLVEDWGVVRERIVISRVVGFVF